MAQQEQEAPIQFFAKQKRIYPKFVKDGRYRRLKWAAMAVTLAIYYLVPFIRWDRGPHMPDQAVLIDLNHARAYWFFFEIWPQEVYILTGILITAAIALFFITSLFGRVWCGYFCPQTVWTDLFMWVENKIQGDRNARQRLREGPWTWEKTWKLALTHVCWLAIAWCTAGSFVLYFNDAPTLVRSFFEFNVSPIVLMFIVGLTFSTYLMAGYAREQVCTYMCPYARFQSAMFDDNTLIIGYDEARGEPRGKHKKGESWDGRGHCIDCTACVQVCPTGIDIRNGLQMECIACGLCVDACDDIMDKMNLPRGLIRYDTKRHMDLKAKGIFEQFRIIRPRSIAYAAVILLVCVGMLYALLNRTPLVLQVLHDRNPLFVQLSSGEIRNGYEIHISNRTHDHQTYTLRVSGLEKAHIQVAAAGNASSDYLYVEAGNVGRFHVFITSNVKPNYPRPITFHIQEQNIRAATDEYESVFISQKPKT
ncbi:MAG: cytochrome c oxidase accessory protein CcoG [Alphaproteobacteria bacterium]|nr:cytochrome c oxidase accessory protein CcoG [Alphaproteobacteria bacterium]